MSTAPDEREQEPEGRRWPLAALALPLLSASSLVWFAAGRADDPLDGRAVATGVARPPLEVDGWFASRQLERGGRLSARLTPLRADPGEQIFGSAALARRLELQDGQAWRLALTYELEASDGESPGPLGLEGLAVHDAEGAACAPLAGIGSNDPVATLFELPGEGLAIEHGLELWLWGRAPAEGASLHLRGGVELPLTGRTIAEAELLGGLASLGDASSPRGGLR